MRSFFLILLFPVHFVSALTPPVVSPIDTTAVSIGITGDPSDVVTPTTPGIVLMGGSTDVDEAIRWMIERSGGGDFVIIRASGSTGYNEYIYELGKVNSVETLLIDSREEAMRPETGKRIREAEALFIAGGDQWNYVNFWTDSEVSSAIDYLINEKKVSIGGTSAGCAVLSDIIFDARHDTVISDDALKNPYDNRVSISKSFIRLPILKDVISDQHYSARNRQGRHVTFMARMIQDFGIDAPKGIGVDEQTAVCIASNGDASVFGSGSAYFLRATRKPEVCKNGRPLTWAHDAKAIGVIVVKGTTTGTAAFNIREWPQHRITECWWIVNGEWKRAIPGK